MFSDLAIKHMRQDWPGLFRRQILHLMPVGKLGERFHPTLGAPIKELYSMAGAIFLKEFFNLAIEETVHRHQQPEPFPEALQALLVLFSVFTSERTLAILP
jgi:hypothetical protein